MLKQLTNFCLGPTLSEATRKANRVKKNLTEHSLSKLSKSRQTLKTGRGEQKLEKSVLSLFGILLQLIVFYLPLLNATFRGKALSALII